MCELCDPDTRQAAREAHKRTADRLLQLSRYYEGLATGRIQPHDGAAVDQLKHAARFMVRHLVEEWI